MKKNPKPLHSRVADLMSQNIIKDYHTVMITRQLILDHSLINGVLNQEHLDEIRKHVKITLGFTKSLLENTTGTIEEKIKFIDAIKEELPNFHGTYKNENKNDNSEND